jgi:hypothetical protein
MVARAPTLLKKTRRKARRNMTRAMKVAVAMVVAAAVMAATAAARKCDCPGSCALHVSQVHGWLISLQGAKERLKEKTGWEEMNARVCPAKSDEMNARVRPAKRALNLLK